MSDCKHKFVGVFATGRMTIDSVSFWWGETEEEAFQKMVSVTQGEEDGVHLLGDETGATYVEPLLTKESSDALEVERSWYRAHNAIITSCSLGVITVEQRDQKLAELGPSPGPVPKLKFTIGHRR